jgi:hypothetical protein
MIEVEAEQLKESVERQHHCKARLAQSVPVTEAHNGATVWEGVVNVFDLTGHPKATRAYAWSSPLEGSDKRAGSLRYCIRGRLRGRQRPCGRRLWLSNGVPNEMALASP